MVITVLCRPNLRPLDTESEACRGVAWCRGQRGGIGGSWRAMEKMWRAERPLGRCGTRNKTDRGGGVWVANVKDAQGSWPEF